MSGTSVTFKIPLAESGVGIKESVDAIVSFIDKLFQDLQRPDGVTLKWGEITEGKYLEANGIEVRVQGPMNFALTPVRNFVNDQGIAFPTPKAEGQLFFRTDTGILYLYVSGVWVAIGVVSAAAVDAAGAVMNDRFVNLGDFLAGAGGGAEPTRIPAGAWPNRRIPVRDDAAAGGWNGVRIAPEVFLDVGDLNNFWNETGSVAGALPPGRPAIFVQDAAGNAAGFTPPAIPGGQILAADDASAVKMSWQAPLSAVGGAFPGRGELLAGVSLGNAEPVGPPPDESGHVLASNPLMGAAMAWTPITSLVEEMLGPVMTPGATIAAYNNFG